MHALLANAACVSRRCTTPSVPPLRLGRREAVQGPLSPTSCPMSTAQHLFFPPNPYLLSLCTLAVLPSSSPCSFHATPWSGSSRSPCASHTTDCNALKRMVASLGRSQCAPGAEESKLRMGGISRGARLVVQAIPRAVTQSAERLGGRGGSKELSARMPVGGVQQSCCAAPGASLSPAAHWQRCCVRRLLHQPRLHVGLPLNNAVAREPERCGRGGGGRAHTVSEGREQGER